MTTRTSHYRGATGPLPAVETRHVQGPKSARQEPKSARTAPPTASPLCIDAGDLLDATQAAPPRRPTRSGASRLRGSLGRLPHSARMDPDAFARLMTREPRELRAGLAGHYLSPAQLYQLLERFPVSGGDDGGMSRGQALPHLLLHTDVRAIEESELLERCGNTSSSRRSLEGVRAYPGRWTLGAPHHVEAYRRVAAAEGWRDWLTILSEVTADQRFDSLQLADLLLFQPPGNRPEGLKRMAQSWTGNQEEPLLRLLELPNAVHSRNELREVLDLFGPSSNPPLIPSVGT